MKKIVLSFFAIMITMVFVTVAVHAYSTSSFESDEFDVLLGSFGTWEVSRARGAETYLFNAVTGYRIESAWSFNENGELVEIDLIQHAEDLNYSNRLNAELMYSSEFAALNPHMANAGENYRFFQTRMSSPLGVAVHVSAEFRGPVTITHTSGVSSAESFSAVAGTNAQRNAVADGANFVWARTSTSQSITTGSWSVPSGSIGRIWFTPRYNQTDGQLHLYLRNVRYRSLGTAWGRSPRQVGGFTDGVFELRTRNG
ncbi:MAG: hypothetical protein FWC70_04270 [Defluviitaleaceae bacterium]|nr:hypothetical protein [Defluviitaleaceae bacterium]